MGSDYQGRVLTLADSAASLLQRHKDALIGRWRTRLDRVIAEKGLQDIVSDSTLQEDTQGLVERLLSRLRGEKVSEEFATFHHWIYDGQQYGVRLSDLVGVMLDLKQAAAETIHHAEPDGLNASRLEAVTSQAVDEMVRRATELYQLSQEADLRVIQDRFQQIFTAWEVDEALARAETSDEAFRMACAKLSEMLPLVGCIARTCPEGVGEKKEFYSKQDLPLPFVRETAQYLTEQERRAGGALDILEACRRRGEPLVRQVAQSSLPNPNQALLFGPPVTDQVVNAVELWAADVRGMACIPLSAGGKTIGAFLLLASSPDAFNAAELRLLGDFSEVLANAFARTTRMEKSQRRMTEAEVIARIGRSLLELPTMEALLQAVVDALQQFRNYAHVSLFRTDEKTGRCILAAQAGPLSERWPLDYMPAIGEGLIGECARKGEPVLSSGWSAERRRVVASGAAAQAEKELSVPVRKGGRTIGVLHLASREPDAFGEDELTALKLLSTHIAIALQNVDFLEWQRRTRYELERVHRQLSTIMRSTAVGITGMDTEGVYTHWSPSCEKMFGYGEAEVVGKMTPTHLAASHYDLKADLAVCLKDGQVVRESTMLAKDGTPHVVQEMIVPMVQEDGRHVGFTCCLVDITEKKEAEDALRQERNKLEKVVEAMGAGLGLFDAERRLQWANSTLMNWFGFDPGMFGQSCTALLNCGDGHTPECPIAKALRTGTPQAGQIERTDRRGDWHCYLQTVTPILHGQKQLLVLMLDVTEQRRQSEQMALTHRLTRALEGTLDLNRVLHVFLTCVTAGHALGFNRAFIFLLDEATGELVGNEAVGPSSAEDAKRIWENLSTQARSLEDLLAVTEPSPGDRLLTDMVRKFRMPMDAPACVLVESLRGRSPIIVRSAENDPRVRAGLRDGLGLSEFVVVPLIALDEPLGVVLADNKFSGAHIDEHRAEELRVFSAQASMAIANARAYRKIHDQYDQLQHAQDELIEAERWASIGQMASHLAHEIRNPLTTVGGFARALQRTASDETTRHNAAVIYKEVIRLERALDNVLEFTRPVRVVKQPTNLNELIDETADQFSYELEDKSVTLKLDLEMELPPAAVDPSLIKQVLINLVRNAIEAVETVERKEILIGTAASEQGIVVSVSDSGCGMDEGTKQHLFAPFFTTKKKGGTGLGLAISHKILGEHGARVEVESELGKGTTFFLIFPHPAREATAEQAPA